MQLAMIGLGRMGATWRGASWPRDMKSWCIPPTPPTRETLCQRDRAYAASSLEDLGGQAQGPPGVWLMMPVAVVDQTLKELNGADAEGGHSSSTAATLITWMISGGPRNWPGGYPLRGLRTSGGVLGPGAGVLLMIGGEDDVVQHLDPFSRALAPGMNEAPRIPGREKVGGTAEHGYLHCGPQWGRAFRQNGAQRHRVRHHGSYAEGLNILRHANVGNLEQEKDAETAPLANPDEYRYDFNLRDVAEVWRRGSVIASWLPGPDRRGAAQ